MVEAGGTQPGRNPPDHRDAQIDLADRGLQAVHDVAGRLQLAQAARRGDKIELDTGEQLAELVVELPRDAGPLLLAHLLEAFGQGRIKFLIRRQRKLQAACTFNTSGGFRGCVSAFVRQGGRVPLTAALRPGTDNSPGPKLCADVPPRGSVLKSMNSSAS